MQHEPAVLRFIALNERQAQNLVASARCKEHTDRNAILHAVDHLLVKVLVRLAFSRGAMRRVLEYPRAIIEVKRRNIGIPSACRAMHREREGPFCRMFDTSTARPINTSIARDTKGLGINRHTVGILGAFGRNVMWEVFPYLAALFLAQEPLPSQNILRRHKAASAVETRPSNQRNTRSDAVHKEPPGKTVPHIIADPERYETKCLYQTVTQKRGRFNRNNPFQAYLADGFSLL